MQLAIDHIFITTSVGAPGADLLRDFGLIEGSPNRHTGQGTACRRFFFRNAMLELIWAEDEVELRSPEVRRTQLWEHWRAREESASPIGIILSGGDKCPFPAWRYSNAMMPGFSIEVAEATSLEEPLWFHFETSFPPSMQPREHPCGFRDLTAVRLTGPTLPHDSVTSSMARDCVITTGLGRHLLELQFDGGRQRHVDFLPDLPLTFTW